MKIVKQLFWLVACFCLTIPAAMADGIVTIDTIENAAKNPNDLSRQMLVMVFGNVVVNPIDNSPTMVGQIFGIFNGIVATLAAIWFLSISTNHVIKAGGRGKFFSEQAGVIGPVKTTVGWLALLPQASGWSMAQLIFLWAASIMGVGSANLLTNKMVDALDSGYSLVVQPVAPQTVSAARAIYEMNLCMYGINSELNNLNNQYGPSGTPFMQLQTLPDGFEITNGNASCGSARLPELTKLANNNGNNIPVDTSGLLAAQHSALNQMQNSLNVKARDFVSSLLSKVNTGTGSLPDAETDIQTAARAYEDTINRAANAQQQDNRQLQSVISAQMKKNGWLDLGSWYQTFATANQKINDAVALKPVVTGPSKIGDVGVHDRKDEIMTAYRAQIKNSPYTPPLGTQSDKDTQQAVDASDPDAVFVGTMRAPMQRLANYIATLQIGSHAENSNQMNPLLKMKAIGDNTLVGSEGALTLFVTSKVWAQVSTKGLWGKVVGAFSGNANEGFAGFLEAVSPFVYFIIFVLFSVGFSLSIYLPFIPFIYWIAAAANWIVSVVVGAIGGSLWAATHIGIEDEAGSRANYGYIFLIDVMFRPMIMVFGFIFASLAIIGIGTLLNLLFAPAIANVQVDSFTGIVSMIGILMIYARICTTSVTRIFSLQVTLPDYIISWLGGREAANMLGGIAESTRNIFGAFGTGAKQAPGVKFNQKSVNDSDDNMDGLK